MAPPRGAAAYKKKDGTIALSHDLQTVIWTPLAPPGGPPVLSFAVSTITNLQQTPASNPKVMLKIFTQLPGASAPETHVFSFTAPNSARAEADAIKDALSVAIQTIKGRSDLGAATSAAAIGGASTALSVAHAVSNRGDGGNAANGWYDDARLLSDVELQKSLLKADPALQKTFMESLRTKPESISNAQFTSQFWSTRIPLVRAHAIETNQHRGAYNVLSTIKSRTDDNVTRLSISKEQIQLIFHQHPLVKRVYDENVPNLNESAFWAKFFQSRLFKRLKGEKIVDSDPLDPVIDKYLREPDEDVAGKNRPGSEIYVPHIIDIEGNEENHSQRRGNQPDLTMRPTSLDKAPIIRALNRLSERIMAEVAPIDVHPAQNVDTSDETFKELALHDLQGDAEEHRIILGIKDQQRFFTDDDDDNAEMTGNKDGRGLQVLTDPAKVLSVIERDLQESLKGSDGMNLQDAIGFDEASDSEDDADNGAASGSVVKAAHVGSQASLSRATAQVLEAIAQGRAQTDDLLLRSTTMNSSAAAAILPPGISAALFDRVMLTHATTTEFLHHFWTVFMCGDANRADELAGLADSLDRALARIRAVAQEAETDRQAEIERRKKEVRDVYQATGKKVRWKPEMVDGGEKAVMDVLGPTVEAVEGARHRYKRALTEAGIAPE